MAVLCEVADFFFNPSLVPGRRAVYPSCPRLETRDLANFKLLARRHYSSTVLLQLSLSKKAYSPIDSQPRSQQNRRHT